MGGGGYEAAMLRQHSTAEPSSEKRRADHTEIYPVCRDMQTRTIPITVDGRWSMADGQWSMVDGWRLLAYSIPAGGVLCLKKGKPDFGCPQRLLVMAIHDKTILPHTRSSRRDSFAMLIAIFCGYGLAVIAPWLIKWLGRRGGLIAAFVPAMAFIWFASHIDMIAHGDTVLVRYPWVDFYAIPLSFHLDGLSLLFALLITGIGTLIFVYAAAYLDGHPRQGRFFAYLAMFMSSMLGLVLANNAIVFFVLWELTSVTSFLLIAFDHERAESRRAALQALIVTAAGGLAMLAGLLILARTAGTYEIADLIKLDITAIPEPTILVVMLLLLAGAFTKSAQWPFSFWLPNAMAAPTPVSAYLHSATMVKGGVYLCLRFNPLFAEADAWMPLLMVFGGVTFIISLFKAFGESDLKRVLAQTTVASLGLLILLIGSGSAIMIEAAIVYLFAHALFKGALFMAAGSVDHGSGSRDINYLGGLAGAMPITAAAALMAALSMGGMPPFIGFLGKELMYADPHIFLILPVLIGGNVLMFALGGVIALRPFYQLPALFSGDRSSPPEAHEGHWGLWIGAMILAIGGLLSGLFAHDLGTWLLAPAIQAVTGTDHAKPISLHLWGGVTPALVLSIVTIMLGLIVLSLSDRKRAWISRRALRINADSVYDLKLAMLIQLSKRITAILHTGRLHQYLSIGLLVPGLAIALGLAYNPDSMAPAAPIAGIWNDVAGVQSGGLYGYEILLMLLIAAASIAAMGIAHRLTAILILGVGGIPLALLFLVFGAPDLAFTQLMVDTLLLAVLALILTRLRVDIADVRSGVRICRDGAIAILFGGSLGAALYAATRAPLDTRLTDYFNAESVVSAHGRNIVNVILVDFRALDTLGEITVVLTAGLAIVVLLERRRQVHRGSLAAKE